MERVHGNFLFWLCLLYVDDHVEMQSMEVAIFRSLSFSLDAPAVSFFFHYVAFKDDCTFAQTTFILDLSAIFLKFFISFCDFVFLFSPFLLFT